MARKLIVVGPFTQEDIQRMASTKEGGTASKGVEFDLAEEAAMCFAVGALVAIMEAIHEKEAESSEPSTET